MSHEVTLLAGVHPDVAHLSWMVGSWRGYGVAEFAHQPQLAFEQEVDFVSDSITIKRIGDKFHGGIHTIEDGVALPIADWNDVKVFLLDVPEVEWYGARNYQT